MRWAALFALATALGACLPEPVPLAGDHLVVGRDVADPVGAPSAAGPQIVFRRVHGDARSIEAISASGGPSRVLLDGAPTADQMAVDSAGVLYVSLGRPGDGASEPLPGVARVDVASGAVLDLFDDVRRLELARDRALLAASPSAAGQPLTLVGPGRARRNVDAAQVTLARSGRLYAAPRTGGAGLLRLDGAAAAPEILPGLANQFWLGPDERRAVMVGVDAAMNRSVAAIDLTGVPVVTPLALGDAVLSGVTLPAGSDRAVLGLLSTVDGRPDGRMRIAVADLGNGSVTPLEAVPRMWSQASWTPDGTRALLWFPGSAPLSVETTPPRMTAPSIPEAIRTGGFSPDGRWFVGRGEGELYRQLGSNLVITDASFSTGWSPVATRALVTPGWFFLDGGRIAFLVDSGEDRPELHVATLAQPPASQPLAREARNVVAGGSRLLAIVDESHQDRAGTLKLFDTATGAAQTLAVAVTDFAVLPACPTCDALSSGAIVAYVIRGRTATDRDGLWVARLP
jgi:hypothetical protein